MPQKPNIILVVETRPWDAMFVCLVGDVIALAEKLRNLIEDPKKREAFGKRSTKMIRVRGYDRRLKLRL